MFLIYSAPSHLIFVFFSWSGDPRYLPLSVGRQRQFGIRARGSLSARQLEAVESCFAVIDRQEFARANSQFIGAVGDKVTLTITVEHIIVLRSEFYGNNYITIARDEQGNAITYKGKTNIGLKGETTTINLTTPPTKAV